MTETKLRPLEDRVVILPYESDKKAGRIYLPDVAQQPACRGIVVAVGPGRVVGINSDGQLVTTPMGVKTGDTVVIAWSGQVKTRSGQVLNAWNGQVVKDGDTEFIVLRMSEIICVVEGVAELSSIP